MRSLFECDSLEDLSIEKLCDDYDKLKAALLAASPFIMSLLRRVRIILRSSVRTAAISRSGVMVINPEFWISLDFQGKAWLLGHEVLHVAFRDMQRKGDRILKVWNIVADAVNNEIEKEFLKPGSLEGFTFTLHDLNVEFRKQFYSHNISLDDLYSMSKEEVYSLLPELTEISVKIVVDLGEAGEIGKTRDIGGIGDFEGTILQDGNPDFFGDEEEQDNKWKEAIAEAYTTQKTAGNVPAGLRRLINRLLKAKVDWRTLLRQAFQDGMGKIIVSSYRRPSRKHPAFPGIRRFTIPRVWCLMDTSGSISKEEATQFLSEIYSIAKMSPVSVVCWDAYAYDVLTARTQSEVISRVVGSLRGGGGTFISPALRKTLKNMRPKDIVIILTDGMIWDIVDETSVDETKVLFAEVASKASVSVFATTRREHVIPSWHIVKVKSE